MKVLAIIGATLLLIFCGCNLWSDSGPTDVVLLVLDTQRAGNLSLYGYNRETSPNLERLARDAVVYQRAIAPGTWTIPSHASIFTGLWPSYHGAERLETDRLLAYPINPEIPTLAEILKRHGFSTAAFVANNTYLSAMFGFARGFDAFVDTLNYPSADKLSRTVIQWLEAARSPYFLFVNFLDPHEPYSPPPPYDTHFPGKRSEYGDMLTKYTNERREVTPEMRAHFLSQYDGETAFSDEAVGRILDTIREGGRYDSSLIIVTSDHGELLGEHGLGGHQSEPYEPAVHVPLVVKYPGNRDAGTRVETRVSTLDIFATILGVVGIALPDGTQSAPLGREQRVFVEDIDSAGRRIRVAYRGANKLVSIISPDGREQTTLYDLDEDPLEERPLSGSQGAEELRSTLLAFSREPRPVNQAALPPIDAEKEAKLKALGYVR